MFSFLLLGHTLKKEGASRITGILPYVAYSREHKPKVGQSLAAAWMGGLLKASGFDEIWTIDLHREQDKQLFSLPLESLSPAPIFHESLAKLELTNASFVSPDQGAIPRCQAMPAGERVTSGQILYFEKHRTAAGIVHRTPVGKVERCAVIVDAILDTGLVKNWCRLAQRNCILRDTRIVYQAAVAEPLVSSGEAYFLHGHDSRFCDDSRFEDDRTVPRARVA